MPKIPRDINGQELARALKRLGYGLVRQSGSHLRLSCAKDGVSHHITIPAHSALKIGTLNSILDDICAFHSITKDELLKTLF
jgi:predicted RNA binding protein YcfA (HicA-like mRNA interferase family)